MNQIEKIFIVKKPVIGMLHLDYLEGPSFKGVDFIVQKALKDIQALEDGGINGILIENWKEESLGEFVSDETKKNFIEVAEAITPEIHIPFGFNVLNNDYKLAFDLAKATNAAFIELDVFVDKVKSDFQSNQNAMRHPFIIDPEPKKMWAYAKSIGAQDIPLFCFVQPKHYLMLEAGKSMEDSTRQAIKNGASAILVTKATGFAPTVDLIKKAKETAREFPIGIGSGFNAENAKDFLPFVDFAVVGTSIKIDDITDNPVDILKVKELMSNVKKIRNLT